MRNNLDNKSLLIMLMLVFLSTPHVSFAQEMTLNIPSDKDTYLREELPVSKYGTQTYIAVGNYTSGRRSNGLLEFTLPSAPQSDAKIVKIKLNLYYYNQLTGGNGYIEALELLENFSELNSNWNERNTGDIWSNPGALAPTSSSASILDSVYVDANRPIWKTFALKEDSMSGVNWNWTMTGKLIMTASGIPRGDLAYNFVSKEATASSPFANADQFKPYLELTYGNDSKPPEISNITTNDTSFIILSNQIKWQTDEPATSHIKYGTVSGSYPYQKNDNIKTTSHSIELIGLKPATRYYFVVNSTDIFGNTAQSSEFNLTTSGNKSIHPFLIFKNIKNIPGYRYNKTTPWSTWESGIISLAKTALNKNFSDPAWRMIYQSEHAMNLGLAYQVTKDTIYAEKAKNALLNMNEDSIPYGIDKSEGVMYYSLAYDWIQPYLNTTEDELIRDNLALLANTVYYDLNNGGTNRGYVSFADYHGQAYPAMGVAGSALFDYNNPNDLPLTSTPADWVKVGTEYLFIDDKLHDFNRSLFSHGFDETGKHLIGAYKAYVKNDYMWWLQVYSFFTGKNIFEEYPIAKKAFTSEIWESMPNHYNNDFITNGNTKWIYHKEIISLLDDDNKAYALNHIDLIENLNLLPNSNDAAPTSNRLLYLIYENYSYIQRKNPYWTSRFDQSSIYQVFRGNWNNNSDWLSLITWNVSDTSNRNMGHHDQMSLEYYSRGDLLLADAGENKHVLDMYYGEYEVHHNTIAIEDPRNPFARSSWSNSSARGIYKGDAVSLKTPANIENLVETPWMELQDVSTTIRYVTDTSWSTKKSLSSPIRYKRDIIYPNKDYFIITDRLEGSEAWGYSNIFRPTSLSITPTLDRNKDSIYNESETGNVNGSLMIGAIPYDWLSLPYKNETITGVNTSSMRWNTTNPYGGNVKLHLFSVPSSDILVTKHVGRIAGYSSKSEVFNPIVYFRTKNTTSLYRVTVLLSRYETEDEKIPSEIPVTGTGNAIKVTSSAYEDYIYSGKGISTFASLSTDADTLYLRKTARPSEYTLLNGSYMNYSGVPMITLSRKADYFTLKDEQNKTTFRIKGSGAISITLHQKNSKATYQVKKDGNLYNNWLMNADKIIISTDPGEHEFEVISNSTPDIIPPSSVTGSINVTYAPYFINWTWIDPSDIDFDHVEIYLDGVYQTNVKEGSQFYNATGLTPGTSYTIGTKTADTSGNVNSTLITHSARTASISDITPPSSVTGLSNISYADNYINCTWTDPIDIDFDHVEIYLNGEFKANVSAGIRYFNATGLNPGTLYTVGTKTVDRFGNINLTLTTHSAFTAPVSSSKLNKGKKLGKTTYVNQTGLAGATISLLYQNGTSSGLTTLSGSEGKFEFNNIEPGLYYVEITKAGHEPNSSSVSNVTSGSTVDIGTVQLILYNIDRNSRVNILDLNYIGQHFSKNVIQPYPFYDVNGDGVINKADLDIIVKHFGEAY